MIKSFNKLGTEEKFLYLKKDIHEKPTVSFSYLMVKTTIFVVTTNTFEKYIHTVVHKSHPWVSYPTEIYIVYHMDM